MVSARTRPFAQLSSFHSQHARVRCKARICVCVCIDGVQDHEPEVGLEFKTPQA